MTNSERKKKQQNRDFIKWKKEQKKFIDDKKQAQINYLMALHSDEIDERELSNRTESKNCLFLLKKDFGISYAKMAELFGYKKGYLYGFTHDSDTVPLPLQRFCQAVRLIKFLQNELKNYEALKNLLQNIGGISQKSSDDLKDFDAIFKNNL